MILGLKHFGKKKKEKKSDITYPAMGTIPPFIGKNPVKDSLNTGCTVIDPKGELLPGFVLDSKGGLLPAEGFMHSCVRGGFLLAPAGTSGTVTTFRQIYVPYMSDMMQEFMSNSGLRHRSYVYKSTMEEMKNGKA